MAVQFDNLGDVKPKVTAGGKDKAKFVPNLNVSFHDDEFYFNLNRKDKIIKNEKAATARGKTSLGGIDTDIWYIDDKGRFKWDIEFASRPAVNSWTWELKHSKGIEFNYQGELTAEEIADGCVRPDEVVGSYAVYCNKANNKYKTGKLCHIYRPFCYDAKGKTIYADLNIADGQMTITIDAAWLDSAAYPVRLDPTLGYTSTPGTGITATGIRILYSNSEAASSGTSVELYIYSRTIAGKSALLGYYNDNGSGGAGTVAGTVTVQLSSSAAWYHGSAAGNIVSGNKYYPAFQLYDMADMYLYYDDAATNVMSNHTIYTGLPDNPSGGTPGAPYYLGVYLEYTESGGATGNSYYYQQQQM